MGDSITVQTEHGDVVVRKMPLSDYAELLKAFDNLPQQFSKLFGGMSDSELKKMSGLDFVAMLPAVLGEAWLDIIEVVAVPTNKNAEFLGKLGLADAVDVVGAILDLNDVPRIIDAVKKMAALKAKLTRPQKQK